MASKSVTPHFYGNQKMLNLPDLDKITSYREPGVLRKFCRDFPADAANAEKHFVELMKYLWLAQKQRIDQEARPDDESLRFLLAIYDDMIPVDNMWHCFILSTRDYQRFCETFFGRFMHHIPDALEDLPPTKEQFAADLEKFASYVFDNLGAETLRTWFGMA